MMIRCILGHIVNNWLHVEHHHDDWYYVGYCDRCGKQVIRLEKPKKGNVISQEPNPT